MNATTNPTTSMHDRAAAVAALMPGWSLGETSHTTDRDGWAHIVHTSGAEISLSLKSWPKPERIHVSGIWPRRQPNGAWGEFMPRDPAPYSINVSPDKTAAQVARDIARRLEGPYLAEYAVQAARMATTLAGEEAAGAAAARIAAAIGETVHSDRGDTHTVWLSNTFDDRRGHGTLKVSPSDPGAPAHVVLELRGITPDEAIRILTVLRGGLQGEAVLATLDPTLKENRRA